MFVCRECCFLCVGNAASDVPEACRAGEWLARLRPVDVKGLWEAARRFAERVARACATSPATRAAAGRVGNLPHGLACLTNVAISIVRRGRRFEHLPPANRHCGARPQEVLDPPSRRSAASRRSRRGAPASCPASPAAPNATNRQSRTGPDRNRRHAAGPPAVGRIRTFEHVWKSGWLHSRRENVIVPAPWSSAWWSLPCSCSRLSPPPSRALCRRRHRNCCTLRTGGCGFDFDCERGSDQGHASVCGDELSSRQLQSCAGT